MTQAEQFSHVDTEDQLVISYELLCLLRWLAENEGTRLKRIINKSLTSGLTKQIQYGQSDVFDSDEAQQSIIDFFYMLEHMMLDSLNEQAVKHVLEKNLIPALDHIDSTVCDDAMIRFSVERASSPNTDNSHENPQELFFKEILKRWKPNKKNTFN